MKLKYGYLCSTLLLIAPVLSAQTFSGYTRSGDDLATITLNGTVYDAASLINSTLTAVTDNNGGLLYNDTSAPATPSSVMSDLSVTSGLLNINSATFTFDEPIVNGAGLDLFILDWGAFGGDTFEITINGATLSNSEFGSYGSLYVPNSDILDTTIFTSAGFSSVADMNAALYTAGNISSTYSGGWALDLSGFGVADGASITSLTITDIGGATIDPMMVMGIPEPGSYALLLGFALGAVCLGRRFLV
ncbi:hypothetical protein [Coraliomargarita parva]|uniref:hypothetical protein n=1 Tax=Coraliomargarita parva TaxID=3014050 RepID=UPI0022B44B99|nr:hypothetical protein [Coraliomargarita parva]